MQNPFRLLLILLLATLAAPAAQAQTKILKAVAEDMSRD